MEDAIFQNDGEVLEVLRGFESCALRPADFDHPRHLTVALALIFQLGDERAAAGRVRAGLAKYLARHGVDARKYHETITVFWVRRVGAFLGRAGAGRGLAALANELARECGDSRLVFEYYSRALIDTEEARASWVEPDLKALDF